MLSMNNMDVPGDGGQLLSDCQDVETLVQDEFHKQIFGENAALGLTQTTVSNTELWDSLWKPIDQSAQPAVNPFLIPLANPGVGSFDDAVFHPVVNPGGKPLDIPDVRPVINPMVNPMASPVVNPVVNPVFCLACDTMFISRQLLEDHVCPFVNFICSCGISFTKYPDMWSHSTSHNHKATYVVNHKSAIQSRISSVKQQEWKLKHLEETAKNVGIAQKSGPLHTAPPPTARYIAGKTLNLWKKFRPVVMLKTQQKFGPNKNYRCAVCGLETCTRDVLIQHVNAVHNNACVYGCSRCGLLLIGRVPPKVLHRCGPVTINLRQRYTFGQLLRDPLAAESLYMPYACQFCSLRFGHQVHLSNHIRSNHNNMTKVPQAPKIIAPPTMIKRVRPSMMKRVPPGMMKGASPGLTKGASPGMTKGASSGMMKTASPGMMKTASPGMMKGASPGMMKGASPGMMKGASPGMMKGAPPSMTKGAPPSMTKGAPPPVIKVLPSGTSQTTSKMRCAVCKRMIDSFETLEQHWCQWTLTLLNPKMIGTEVSRKAQPRLDSPLPLEKDSSEESVHSEDGSNVKTYGHTKLLTIKTEPVEVNVTMTQTDVSRKTVKPEPELPDHDNGAGKAPAEINGLFYQKCSASNTNNLKYLFSNI